MAKRRRALKSVFLDSSVLFTAVNSPTGGSSKLFSLKNIRLITSSFVLVETERNVRKKLQSYQRERFFMLVKKLEILNQVPDENIIQKARKIIVEKDAVILAEAKKAKASFLVTLDRKHFLTDQVAEFLKPQKVLPPKDLISVLGKRELPKKLKRFVKSFLYRKLNA